MKKTTLCAAALLACLSGATQAQQSSVTLYGLASLELLSISGYNGGTLAAPAVGNARQLNNSKVTNSRLGFRGTEDLGGGLSAIFELESAIALDSGAQAHATKFWNRGSFVGFKSASLGTLTFGRQWNVQDAALGRFFIGGGYAVFQFGEFGYVSDLVDGSVKYVSPDLSGVTVRLLATPRNTTTGQTLEAAVNYVAGPFEAGGTVRRYRNVATGLEDRQSALGASYTLGDWRIHAGAASSDAPTLGKREARAYDLGLVWNATPITQFTLDYVRRDLLDSPDDSYFVRLQGTYQMSRRTALFANLVTLRNQGAAAEKFYGAGAAGRNQNVVSLGIRHAF
ncbi:MAG: porin [Acidovorax sp.]|uniref:porin n=1 Tax=Acidovorax sp. TaxID=1872122 RepID=UPI0039E22EB9